MCHNHAYVGTQQISGSYNISKSKEESRPFRLQHCWNWPEYLEESWRAEETCSHESLLANSGMKNLEVVVVV